MEEEEKQETAAEEEAREEETSSEEEQQDATPGESPEEAHRVGEFDELRGMMEKVLDGIEGIRAAIGDIVLGAGAVVSDVDGDGDADIVPGVDPFYNDVELPDFVTDLDLDM